MVRRLLATLVVLLALVSVAHPATTAGASTTTVPVDQGDRSVIPDPNTGREPTDPGDRGGWAQLVLFGLMAAGCAVIFGRVLWAGHQRSRLNQAQPED
ncbi:MAG TPA: hypothetical protein VFP08_06140 [Acidimicrobiales bacterium]|nr:hypothetical protein [Acidimicrobiales bacterium]